MKYILLERTGVRNGVIHAGKDNRPLCGGGAYSTHFPYQECFHGTINCQACIRIDAKGKRLIAALKAEEAALREGGAK